MGTLNNDLIQESFARFKIGFIFSDIWFIKENMNNMKNLLLASLALISITISANPLIDGKYGADSVQCVTNISLYNEYVKQKL